MTHFIAALLAIATSFALCSATPTVPSTSPVAYFRAGERPEWQLDTSAAGPADAASASRAPASEPLSFLWIFPLRNLDWLKAEVDAIHDPASPRFLQRHAEQYVDATIGPSSADKDEVRAWLRGHGVDDGDVADWRHSLKVDSTVGVVEALFNTTMHRYRHAVQNRTATVARSSIYVPAALAPRLQALDGVYKFPHTIYHIHAVRASARSSPTASTDKPQDSVSDSDGRRSRRASNASHTMHAMQTQESNTQCPASFAGGFFFLLSPASLASQYSFDERNTATASQPTRAGVAGGFAGQTSSKQTYYEAYSPADLAHFKTNVGFSAPFTAVDYNSNNANNLQTNTQNTGTGPTREATLDIQALFQVSPTSANGFYAVTGTTSGLYTSLAGIYALSSSVRPQAVSYSYSFGISDWDYTLDDAGVTENALMVLAMAGVTIIASAGDDGAPSSYNTDCAAAQTVDARAAPSAYSNSVMLPQYPASSAYVLSVAETQFLYGATSVSPYVDKSVNTPPECSNCPGDQDAAYLCQKTFLPETAVSVTNTGVKDGTTTGGGFSFKFAMPSFQQTAVSSYLARCPTTQGCSLPAASQYNAANRAYPDVAAFGGYFGIVYNGKETTLSGTSVSAPIWAGLIARLNEVALAKYGTTLGLVAPLFYNMSATQPATFNDITTGNNICPRDNPGCVTAVNGGTSTSCAGFRGLAGWDPVTGLGSPNMYNMLAFLQGTGGAIHFASTGRGGAMATSSVSGWLLAALLLAAAVVQLI